MNIKEAAKKCLFAQDACNLSGLVHSFPGIMEAVIEDCRAKGNDSTDARNRHPIVRLYVDKLVWLSGSDTGISEAYAEVQRLAEG